MGAKRGGAARFGLLLGALFLAGGADRAIAAGYAVDFQSVSGAGTAYAGGAAAVSDASTIHYNPAGLTLLDGNQMIVGVHAIGPSIDFDNGGAILASGAPLSGGEGSDGGKDAAIPNLYFVWGNDSGITFGLGINAPYGLVTQYDAGWVGRYNELTTSLKTVNVNPSAAYRLTDKLSVGVGLDLQYVRAKLSQAIDFGTVCAAALGTAACTADFNIEPQKDDGTALVSGWDVAYGFNAGLLYEPTPSTRIGVHYRSRINYTIDLDADFDVPTNVRTFLAAAGTPNAFTNGGAETKITIPETASLSVYHRINPVWAVMADVTWTRWRQFDEVRIIFDEVTTPVNLLETSWSDVYRISAGVTYEWNDALTLRGGLAIDESPISSRFRGPGIPDSDRYILAMGLGYRLSDSLTADIAYQHLFLKNGATRRLSATGSILNGDFDIDIDVVSAGLTWNF